MVISVNLTSLSDKVKLAELSTLCLIWGNKCIFEYNQVSLLCHSSNRLLTSCSVKRMSVYRSCKSKKFWLSYIENVIHCKDFFIITVTTHIHIISLPDLWMCLFNQAVHKTGLKGINKCIRSPRVTDESEVKPCYWHMLQKFPGLLDVSS